MNFFYEEIVFYWHTLYSNMCWSVVQIHQYKTMSGIYGCKYGLQYSAYA